RAADHLVVHAFPASQPGMVFWRDFSAVADDALLFQHRIDERLYFLFKGELLVQLGFRECPESYYDYNYRNLQLFNQFGVFSEGRHELLPESVRQRDHVHVILFVDFIGILWVVMIIVRRNRGSFRHQCAEYAELINQVSDVSTDGVVQKDVWNIKGIKG